MFKHKYRKVPSKTTNTKCYECSRTFISVEKLHIHMESVHYGQSFECDECGETFTRKDSLHRHSVVTHRGKDFGSRFECEECEGTFTRKEDLTRHQMEAHKNVDIKEFECKDCQKKFRKQETLDRHAKTVHLLCKYCGKEFIKKRKLEMHMRGVHEGIENEPFKCNACDKYVENKKKHEESMKICKFCSENFCTSRALGAHLNSNRHTCIVSFAARSFQRKVIWIVI